MQIQIIVSGIVQGVFYRAFAKRAADEMEIKGSVRNLPDNRVEVYAEGDEATLERFVEILKRGPPKSKVHDVSVKQTDGHKFDGFEIVK